MGKHLTPKNENERILDLIDLDLDYTSIKTDFQNLVALTAKITGMDVSLINLIDSLTQWTIAKHGFEMDSMNKEDSVCQYTIIEDEQFEIIDLSADSRFKDKFYVAGKPNFKYYFGVPLKSKEGINIGTLCVLNQKQKNLSFEKIELLKIIANEVVNKLKDIKLLNKLKEDLYDADKLQKKIAGDIRNPLAGIVGITDIIVEQGVINYEEETLEYVDLINNSSKSILEITDEILKTESTKDPLVNNQFNLTLLKNKLALLFNSFANKKNINLHFQIEEKKETIVFQKNNLLQVIGILLDQTIKLTAINSTIIINLGLAIRTEENRLTINIQNKQEIRIGKKNKIYQQVMVLVGQIIERLNGEFINHTNEKDGIFFALNIPQKV